MPKIPVQFPDYAAWQWRWLTGEHLAAQASLALNLIGMCMAGGIGLLVLGLPLFLTIGVVAAVRKQ